VPGFRSLSALSFCVALLLVHSPCRGGVVALVGGRVYRNPEQVVADGVVLIDGERIVASGAKSTVRIPPGAEVIDCTGLTIAAGFWNSHVHFTAPQWENAASLPAARVSQQLERMLTRYGFTTVFDTGSRFENTQALRLRINRGEVPGPRILTTGEPLVARDGTPYYLKPLLLPELLTPPQATAEVRRKLAAGADAIKLHTGAITDHEQDRHTALATDLVRAVTAEAHRQGKVVFAHPQYMNGWRAAIDGGVDVLAHVTEESEGWPRDLLASALRKHVALIPTLKLLAGTEPSRKQQGLLRQVREYLQAGGQILFGTDAGFIPDYDPSEEYVLLQQAGMSPAQILAALTTAPVSRFGGGIKAGEVVAGYRADVVVVEGNPAADIRALAKVRYTIRGGKFIYQRP
jgi:imidazolonepropionase-like amidohydrolase